MRIKILVVCLVAIIGFFAVTALQNIDTRQDLSYASVKYFINTDETDEHPYIDDVYDCSNFSEDTQYNASLQDIKCAFVAIFFEGGTSHAVIAFNTTDRGLIFFEPQADLEVDCEIGGYYVMPRNRVFKIQDLEYLWYVLKEYET